MSDNQTNLPQNEQPEIFAVAQSANISHSPSQTNAASANMRHQQPEQHLAASQPIVIEQKSSGKGLAAGALVLSILALGASGFLFTQGQNVLKNQELKLSSELDKAALGNSENGILLQNTLNKQAQLSEQVAQLSQNEQEQAQRLQQINAAYAELLKGRVNWLVDEVEATLNVASQQLLLSGNVPVAVGVLEAMEQRLSRFEQPELLPIKQAISQDLAALKERPYLNVSASTLRLDRLQSSVSGLPLTLDDVLRKQNTPEPPSQAQNFWQRTWDNTTNMIKGMVEVRHIETDDAMLLAPEQVYFVRENVRLRLLDARLALLQHNSDVYQSDLNAVETAVKQYFDVNSPNTQAWLKELAELKALEIRMISDDALQNSMLAVRHYQNNVSTSLLAGQPENIMASIPSAPAASNAASASTPALPSSASAAVSASAVAASAPVHSSASAVASKAASMPDPKKSNSPAKSAPVKTHERNAA